MPRVSTTSRIVVRTAGPERSRSQPAQSSSRKHDARCSVRVRDRSLRCGPRGAGAAGGGRRPNILVIFGDDIGLANISAYSHGLMGYQTPNIDRIAREGMMFIDYYAEQSCTAGRSTFITGQATLRTGLSKVGAPARPGRAAGPRSDDRAAPEAARLRHRPVRQEPPRRSQPVPADRARVRRVLRQPLPPERRGGARELQLPERPALSRAVRPARRAALQGDATPTTRPSSRAGAGSAGRRSRIPAR